MTTRAAGGGDGDPSLADLRRIDAVCDRFEAAWVAGRRPEIASFLGETPGPPSAALFRELLSLEREFRLALGEKPVSSEYAGRFPALSGVIDEVFGPAGTAPHSPRTSGPGGANTPPVTEFGAELAWALLSPSTLEALRAAGYEVLGELGRGGMGVVYLARKLVLGRLCALKMIQAGSHAGPSALARFQAEATAVARLRHPGVVQIYHVGEADGLPYLELEYIPGGNLATKAGGLPQPAPEAARLVGVVARSIAEAHRRGIVHRDLKPANILLESDGRPKVADFGLAKFLDSDNSLTKTHAVFGSPSYMAPEQAQGQARLVGPATDVHALGAILYELLTGRPPFRAATAMETLEQVKYAERVPPSRLQPGLPRDVETVCLKCLEKSPARRYPTAESLADDLGRYLAGEPVHARPSPAWERAWKWSRRRPGATAAIAAGVAGVVLLSGSALFYGAHLRAEVRAAEAAQKAVAGQRNLALKALDELVYGDREELTESPATRPLRRRQLTAAIAVLNEVARGAETSAPDLSRAVAHQKLGDIFRQVGHADEARRQYDLSRQLAERLAARSGDDAAIEECLRETRYGLGALRMKAGEFAAAADEFRAVVATAEHLVDGHPGRDGSRRGLLESYLQLGRALGFDHKLGEAATWFRAMRDRAEAWAAAEPGNRPIADLLASSYRKLADVHKLTGHPAEARDDYLKAIAIGRRNVAAEPGNLTFKGHLAIALHDVAGVASRGGQVEQARDLFRDSEALFAEKAAADPDDLETEHRLLHAQFDLAVVERNQHRYADACAAFGRALARLRRLDHEGRLDRRGAPDWLLPEALGREIAACESHLAAAPGPPASRVSAGPATRADPGH